MIRGARKVSTILRILIDDIAAQLLKFFDSQRRVPCNCDGWHPGQPSVSVNNAFEGCPSSAPPDHFPHTRLEDVPGHVANDSLGCHVFEAFTAFEIIVEPAISQPFMWHGRSEWAGSPVISFDPGFEGDERPFLFFWYFVCSFTFPIDKNIPQMSQAFR